MDPDIRRLIDQLCTQAGMIMEDCSAIAISSRDINEQDLTDCFSKLAVDLRKTLILLDAAHSLVKL